MSDALFDVEPVDVPPPPVSSRVRRQAEAMRSGAHALCAALGTHIPLHPDAAPPDDREAPGLRCGTCDWRRPFGGAARNYWKCTAGATATVRYPRTSHGAGTDVRVWWPACTDWQPRGVPR